MHFIGPRLHQRLDDPFFLHIAVCFFLLMLRRGEKGREKNPKKEQSEPEMCVWLSALRAIMGRREAFLPRERTQKWLPSAEARSLKRRKARERPDKFTLQNVNSSGKPAPNTLHCCDCLVPHQLLAAFLSISPLDNSRAVSALECAFAFNFSSGFCRHLAARFGRKLISIRNAFGAERGLVRW